MGKRARGEKRKTRHITDPNRSRKRIPVQTIERKMKRFHSLLLDARHFRFSAALFALGDAILHPIAAEKRKWRRFCDALRRALSPESRNQ